MFAGRRTPFHPPGLGCHPYTVESRRNALHVACRDCGRRCYLVSHDGGYVLLEDLGWPWPKHPCFEKRFRGVASAKAIEAAVSRNFVVAVPPHRELTSSNASKMIPRMSEPELKKALIDAHRNGESSLYDMLKDSLREKLRIVSGTPRRAPEPPRMESIREVQKSQANKIRGKNW